MSTPIKRANERFNRECMNAMPPTQYQVAAWQGRNFGAATMEQIALGVAEESGELCHAVLKRSQKIRGMDDRAVYRVAAGDAIADCAIYLMQAATMLRLDFNTLVNATADKVMERNWKKDPAGGGEVTKALTLAEAKAMAKSWPWCAWSWNDEDPIRFITADDAIEEYEEQNDGEHCTYLCLWESNKAVFHEVDVPVPGFGKGRA